MRRNRLLQLELVEPRSRQVLIFEALCFQLGRILDAAEAAETAVGVLTTQDRDTWADARQKSIRASSMNEESLRIIESSLLILKLD
ncbi:unnamed protein product [Hyaloperonospora brassicae]|uniref:Choline/carnitine acyltransferase domain-containing protein n=1 Tax=Hyaloperonospora brassicae TaxID=162125 RepID=A0AAV0UGQ1_HYABA|nr:unnamed protein product [Hyaloperonospora brassicae]